MRSTVIVHRDPIAGSYLSVENFTAPSIIAPVVVPECQLDLGWLFG
jgi:hypothetical protein